MIINYWGYINIGEMSNSLCLGILDVLNRIVNVIQWLVWFVFGHVH